MLLQKQKQSADRSAPCGSAVIIVLNILLLSLDLSPLLLL